jgi:hypothetical protein
LILLLVLAQNIARCAPVEFWPGNLEHPEWNSTNPIWFGFDSLFTIAHAFSHPRYPDCFTLWKDADSDIPILKEAKAEYAKLR